MKWTQNWHNNRFVLHALQLMVVNVLSVCLFCVQRSTHKKKIKELMEVVNRDPLAELSDQDKELVYYMRWDCGALLIQQGQVPRDTGCFHTYCTSPDGHTYCTGVCIQMCQLPLVGSIACMRCLCPCPSWFSL